MVTRGVVLIFATSVIGRTSFGSRVGICDPASQRACEKAYLDCKLSFPVTDKEAICGCAAIYYRACLPEQGCAAAEEMISCVEDLMQYDCPEMSVCGNDCTLEDGELLPPVDSILLPVNNFGANYLQLSVCSKDVSTNKLNNFGQVSMEKCTEDDFRVCDLWIAPQALTTVAFPPDVTHLRVEQCVLMAASQNDDDAEDEEEEAWECLDDPLPLEYYGTTAYYATSAGGGRSSLSHWPSSVDVNYSSAVICQKDSHCPGSFCDLQQQPRICAPKVGDHLLDAASHFFDPRWKILGFAGDE